MEQFAQKVENVVTPNVLVGATRTTLQSAKLARNSLL